MLVPFTGMRGMLLLVLRPRVSAEAARAGMLSGLAPLNMNARSMTMASMTPVHASFSSWMSCSAVQERRVSRKENCWGRMIHQIFQRTPMLPFNNLQMM